MKAVNHKLFFVVLLLFLFLGAAFIYAQKPLEVVYPEIPGALTPISTKTALPDYIRYVFQFSLILAALIAFGSFIYGGVRYLTSAGFPSAQKDAKSRITAGVLGLIILVSAYLILNTINPQLVALKVSLPGKVPTALPAAGPQKPEPATLLEIPLGGLIENLWGTKNEPKKADCYDFDWGYNEITERYTGTGDAVVLMTNYNRLDCIEELSGAITVKAQRLKEPIKKLRELYDCQNCCRDCCKNACGNENWVICEDVCDKGGIDPWWYWENCPLGSCCKNQDEGCWENGKCGSYECCEGKGMVKTYSYSCQKCPYSCCEFFEACPCSEICGFETDWCERCNCICIKEDEEGKPVCCNFEKDSAKPYEDLLVRSLIDKDLLSEEEKENDPYKDLTDIKTALKELRIKLGLFPLTEGFKNNKKICCPDDTCPPDEKIGVIDCLLKNSDTKDLIKEILIGEPPDEEKLKEILKMKSVMTYLIENGWLSTNKNLAKIMMREIGLLKNEVALNEIAWMGTQADSADEWLELYNNTKENIAFETDDGNWTLKTASGNVEIELSGIIPAQGFYLLENNKGAVSDIEDDLIYSGNLADSGEVLGLYDEFGNLVEEMNCGSEWFAGDEDLKASMERINPKGCLNVENWATNLSAKVEYEERKKDYINGKDKKWNPIYGTPKNPNSVGVSTVAYPPFNSLVGELRDKLRREETLREKLILVLRNDENLEKMLKTKEALKDILAGDDWRLKNLLNRREVLQILLEDKDNLDAFLNDPLVGPLVQEVFRKVLNMEGEENDDDWEDFITNKLDEARINSKLINEFQRDLQWVLNASDLMRGCDEDPISYDQLRVPEEFISNMKIEKVPEWENIETESRIIEGADPTIFYCHEPLW